jgi:hypothetical protein
MLVEGIFQEGSEAEHNMLQNTHTNTSVCNPTNEGQSIQDVRGVGGFIERYHSNYSHGIIIIIEIIGNSSSI